jgi:hypothetical protein
MGSQRTSTLQRRSPRSRTTGTDPVGGEPGTSFLLEPLCHPGIVRPSAGAVGKLGKGHGSRHTLYNYFGMVFRLGQCDFEIFDLARR